MKKLFFVAVVIAVLAAFFASAHPDGLDFISEQFGFAEHGVDHAAPMPDYGLTFLPEGGISTSLAGVAGILIMLAIFWLTAYILKKGDNNMDCKRTCCFVVLLAGLVVLGTSPVFAARPLVTDDFGTVDSGAYELEVGYSSSTPKVGGPSTDGAALQIKRGFLSNFDLGLEIPYALTAPTGLQDAILHAKLKLMQTSDDEGLSFRLDVKLTNGDSATGLGTGYVDYAGLLIYSKAFGEYQTHYNLGYTLVGVAAGAASANTLNYSAAVVKALREDINLMAECYFVDASGTTTANAQVGVNWQVKETVKLDAGYSLALNDNSNNVIAAGVTVGF